MTTDAQPSLTSRGLVVAWCAWLLASWVINLMIDGPSSITGPEGQRLVAPDGFVPSVRGLVISAMAGLSLVWPAWRLSQPQMRWPGWRTLADVVSLLLVWQVVLWPLRLVMPWSMQQAVLVDLTMVVWTVAAAMCVWAGLRGATPAARSSAMLAAVILALGGWVVTAVSGDPLAAGWSPFYQLWTLSTAAPGTRVEPLLWRVGVLAGLSVVAWVVMLVTVSPRRRGGGYSVGTREE